MPLCSCFPNQKLPRNGVNSGEGDGITFASLGWQTPEASLILGFNRPAIVEASDADRFLPPGIHEKKLRTLLAEDLESDNLVAVMRCAHQERAHSAKIFKTRRTEVQRIRKQSNRTGIA